jgi:hypothetical protein
MEQTHLPFTIGNEVWNDIPRQNEMAEFAYILLLNGRLRLCDVPQNIRAYDIKSQIYALRYSRNCFGIIIDDLQLLLNDYVWLGGESNERVAGARRSIAKTLCEYIKYDWYDIKRCEGSRYNELYRRYEDVFEDCSGAASGVGTT